MNYEVLERSYPYSVKASNKPEGKMLRVERLGRESLVEYSANVSID